MSLEWASVSVQLAETGQIYMHSDGNWACARLCNFKVLTLYLWKGYSGYLRNGSKDHCQAPTASVLKRGTFLDRPSLRTTICDSRCHRSVPIAFTNTVTAEILGTSR